MGSTAYLVIAGGSGTRYGEPKYAAEFDGATFLDRSLALVGTVARPGDSTWVALRAEQPWNPPPGVRLVRDDARVAGPVAGLLAGVTALVDQASRSAGSDGPVAILITMPVDMPYLTAPVMEALRDTCAAENKIIVARSAGSGDTHWPLAAYPGPVLAAVAELVGTGRHSLRDIAGCLGFGTVDVDDDTARNINHRQP